MKRVNRTTCSLSLDRVDGRPFQVDGVDQPWAVYISSPSKVIEEQLVDVAGLLAANPSAALLRVFGEVPRVQHVLRLRRRQRSFLCSSGVRRSDCSTVRMSQKIRSESYRNLMITLDPWMMKHAYFVRYCRDP